MDSITTALKELERHGYLTRQRLRYENGQLGDIEYTIHEKPVNAEKQTFPPKRENPRQVNPGQAKPEQVEPGQENPAQLNTNPQRTKKSKTDISRTHQSIYPAEPEAAGRPDGMDRIGLIDAYNKIIKENIEYARQREPGETLEDIYRRFNIDHPEDFRGHSLSVSDVVVLHENGADAAYYVDSIGFKELPGFFDAGAPEARRDVSVREQLDNARKQAAQTEPKAPDKRPREPERS